ncbi:hypothetical protein PENSPDRAFT_737371 [Peniophora sp. CONT]|nr:hypothetical protein PENSPDRAFT_737371 [Peniophora sp. CONT]
MDLLYPEKKDAFDSLVIDFTPAKQRRSSMLLSSNRSRSQIISRIDTDAARLDDISRALRAERNSFVPLLGLPVEVLGNIIELCAREDVPRPITIHKARKHYAQFGARAAGWLGWVRLGHVCSFIRRVILEMPSLWANVVFTLPKGHAKILARARSAPLTIDIRLHLASRELIASAKTHLPSARVLRVIAGPGQTVLANVMHEWVKQELKELEELDLSDGIAVQNVTRDMVDLSPLRTPRLLRLRLQNYFLPLNYSSLETLILFFHDLPSSFDHAGPSMFHGHALLAVLSRCMSLQHLYLEGTQFEALSPPSPSRVAISLPSLKRLRVNSTATFCRSVWLNLVLGWHTCVEVTLIQVVHPHDEAEEDAFITELVHHSGEPEAPTITGVRLDYLDWDLRLALATNRVDAFTTEGLGPFKEGRVFTLDVCCRRIDLHSRSALFVRLLSELPTHIELTEVNALVLTLPWANLITTPEWNSLLAPFNHVRDLVCNEFPPQRGFWDALCPAANSTDATFILPHLHTLFIGPNEPKNIYDGDVHIALAPEQFVAWEDMPAGLGRRAEQGAGIQRIMLGIFWDILRAVDPEDVHTLRCVVPQVVDTREYKDGHLVIPPYEDYSFGLWRPNRFQ